MPIKKITEKQKTAFNKASTHPLQSWEWGGFRKATGNDVVRLAAFEGSKLTSAIQVMMHQVPATKYKIGTLIKGPKPTKEILEALKNLAKEENLVFVKLEPNVKKDQRVIDLLKNSGAVPGKTLFTPTTFWIDLTLSEDKLLAGFHSKTRYNIRLAQKRGVRVVEDNSEKAFEAYIQLTRETVGRQGFYAHTEAYHQLMWKHLHIDMVKAGSEPIARLLTATYNPPSHRASEGRGGEIITTWIVFVWHDYLYYPYGASSDKYKNVMANNLMMWEAIKYGKRLGLKTFDLWGREPGKGFTRFKERYNPKVIEFVGTWDLVTSPLYYLYQVAELARWAILRTRSKLGFVKPKF